MWEDRALSSRQLNRKLGETIHNVPTSETSIVVAPTETWDKIQKATSEYLADKDKECLTEIPYALWDGVVCSFGEWGHWGLSAAPHDVPTVLETIADTVSYIDHSHRNQDEKIPELFFYVKKAFNDEPYKQRFSDEDRARLLESVNRIFSSYYDDFKPAATIKEVESFLEQRKFDAHPPTLHSETDILNTPIHDDHAIRDYIYLLREEAGLTTLRNWNTAAHIGHKHRSTPPATIKENVEFQGIATDFHSDGTLEVRINIPDLRYALQLGTLDRLGEMTSDPEGLHLLRSIVPTDLEYISFYVDRNGSVSGIKAQGKFDLHTKKLAVVPITLPQLEDVIELHRSHIYSRFKTGALRSTEAIEPNVRAQIDALVHTSLEGDTSEIRQNAIRTLKRLYPVVGNDVLQATIEKEISPICYHHMKAEQCDFLAVSGVWKDRHASIEAFKLCVFAYNMMVIPDELLNEIYQTESERVLEGAPLSELGLNAVFAEQNSKVSDNVFSNFPAVATAAFRSQKHAEILNWLEWRLYEGQALYEEKSKEGRYASNIETILKPFWNAINNHTEQDWVIPAKDIVTDTDNAYFDEAFSTALRILLRSGDRKYPDTAFKFLSDPANAHDFHFKSLLEDYAELSQDREKLISLLEGWIDTYNPIERFNYYSSFSILINKWEVLSGIMKDKQQGERFLLFAFEQYIEASSLIKENLDLGKQPNTLFPYFVVRDCYNYLLEGLSLVEDRQEMMEELTRVAGILKGIYRTDVCDGTIQRLQNYFREG